MKLRSRSNVEQLKRPVKTAEAENYTRELQDLFRELSKWDECPTIRIDIILDIFNYVDKNVDNVKHEMSLKSLHTSILNKARLIMNDISVASSTVDSIMLENLKNLAIISISIISKLG